MKKYLQLYFNVYTSVICLLFLSWQLKAQSIVVKPYLQDIDTSSVIIMWETDGPGTGTIEWGADPFSLLNSVSSSSIIGSGSSEIHTGMLLSLDSNTKYYYRIKMAGGAESYVYNFRTGKAKNSEASISLIAISDMQRDGSKPNIFEELIKDGIIPIMDSLASGDLASLLDAVLIPGDLVPTGGSYSQWEDYFFSKADSLFPYVPVYPVLGNHEYASGGKGNFLKYFTLPENGSVGNIEEWWYKDISNTRVVGLNSNAPGVEQDTQLVWLQSVLDDACTDETVDFLFAELHHPYKSELWTPGENDFTGEVIEKLEDFSSSCNKPSIHFFGHTHAYSRGQSRDHEHLWVNVATAGGAIDNWGEFPNADYEEFVKSQDEYGFVRIDVDAGLMPSFKLIRYGRGDEIASMNNVIRDTLVINRYETKPNRPICLFPYDEVVNPSCFTLKANGFEDIEGDLHQASHWQISTDSLDFQNALILDSWKQSENWYNEINTQANDDLTDEFVGVSLNPLSEYFWRLRYRDEHLKWSDWSSITPFETASLAPLSGGLVLNGGAESGLQDWTGDIEVLTSGQCNSVPVYMGTQMFAVGGICANQSSYGRGEQNIDLSLYTSEISNGDVYAKVSGYLRNFSGSDTPSIKLEFLDEFNSLISTSDTLSNNLATWTLKVRNIAVPTNTKSVNLVLEGFRNSGVDNDSYFDDIELSLEEGDPCSNYDPCPIVRNMTNILIDQDQIVSALDTINSSSIISGTSNIKYTSGQEVNLELGFSVDQGSILEILLDNCQ